MDEIGAVKINASQDQSKNAASTSSTKIGIGTMTPAIPIHTSCPGTSSNDKQKTKRLSFLSGVELKVFQTFVEKYKASRELRREDAVALSFMFGPTIQQVFEMVQEDHVTIRQGLMTRRVLVEVCGKSGDTYWIPPGYSLCQCMAFIHGKKEYCKHVLAAHLYLAITPKEKYKAICEAELSKIYKECLEGP